ncbi:hypothetical protein BASA81_015404 [Batrachochytrium salamandrivorans]|nr:hypothetical protein BASA81_015404 [Batrachochytrium salamandrivorans]
MFRRFGSEAKPEMRSPKPSTSKKNAATATVTMDDLFGSTASKFNSDGFDSMGDGEEEVGVFQRQQRQPQRANGKSLFFQRKTKPQPGGPSQSSFDALFHAPPGSSGNTGTEDFEMSAHSTVSTAAAMSQSSFEAVYEPEAMDFEFDNPFLSGQVKDAAVRVLYDKSSSSTEEKARMLFLLEQLNKPAPPVLPPKLNPITTTNHVGTSRQAFPPLRKRQIKKVLPYNPIETALGLPTSQHGFLPMLEMVREFKQAGWRLRVEVLRDFCFQLKLLHSNGKAHNGLHVEANCLVSVDSFKGCLANELDSIQFSPMNSSLLDQKRDVLMLGQVMLFTCCAMSPLTSEWKDFTKVIELELVHPGGAQEQLDVCELADQQVRNALGKALTPGSLLELCAQCCAGDHSLRPNSEDAWDWLDSIVGDMHTASAGHILPQDQQEAMAGELRLIKKLQPILQPKLIDLYSGVDDGNSSTSSNMSFLSIETNDSYQPPVDGSSPPSKLTGFLTTKEEPIRARSLSNFLNSTATTTATTTTTTTTEASIQTAGQEAWQQERTRRRSLDRGYMWAKSKLEEEEQAKARKLKRQTLNKQLVTQDLDQFQQARYQVAPASKHTRKCEELAQLFENQERIPQEEALGILKKAEALLRKEKNLLELKPPVVIVGDIHGQFFDLLNMFKLTGGPGSGKNKTSYLFLGDYVDRGDFSCEVILYLLALKCEFPEYVYLLRGNHECRTVSSYFGFKQECEMKYGPVVFNRCIQVFQVMPIAGLINTLAGRFLCLHGGISPNFTTLEQFKEFDRFIEPGMNGFLCDILWSDPVKDGEEGEDKLSLGEFLSIDYLPNPARGCSYRYGFKALVSFLAVNKLVCLIRAHEVQMGGYRYHFQELTGGGGQHANNKGKSIQMTPPVVTVFSAPNYTGKYGNLGAVLKLHPQPPGIKAGTSGKKTGGTGFRPLELVEPIQYQQASNIPPPMVLNNEHKDQVLQITNTCPYMPTTFRAFIKSALEIAEEEDKDEEILARQRQRASRQLAPAQVQVVSVPPQIQEYEDELDALVARAEMSRMSLTAKLTKSLGGGGSRTSNSSKSTTATVEAPHGPAFVKQSDRIKASKFEAAADNDGMNEMNPDLIHEKMEIAQKKIAEKQLAGSDGVKVFKASTHSSGGGDASLHKQQHHHSLGKSPSQRLIVGDKLRPESVRKTSNTVPTAVPEEEGAMSFSSKELLALQMLFLLIDREDKGLIDQEDLLAWSAEEGGYAVQPFEAEVCLKAVDSDEDGKIGFEDYLAFAARSKDRWLVAQYENVIQEATIKELTWDSY